LRHSAELPFIKSDIAGFFGTTLANFLNASSILGNGTDDSMLASWILATDDVCCLLQVSERKSVVMIHPEKDSVLNRGVPNMQQKQKGIWSRRDF
jgi:hypothetical protein